MPTEEISGAAGGNGEEFPVLPTDECAEGGDKLRLPTKTPEEATTERKHPENDISPHKKVEFSSEIRMEPGGNINKRREGSTPPTNGLSTKRRSEPSGTLMNEIRKMSLASQDAKEEKEKKSTKKTLPRRYGRRRKRKEEEYTDKDRAAAVTLGSRDIKQSLKAKKKRERKLCLSLELMNSEDFLTAMLINEALAQLRLKKTKMALATLNKALELQPHNKGALVARSQCHLKLGEAELALKDAETTFDVKDPYIMGLFLYAEALYNLGQFEKALISYHRGFRLRQDMNGFRIGVQKCQEAIRRAIGDHKATQIDDLDVILPIIDEMDSLKSHIKCHAGTDGSELYQARLANKLKAQTKTRNRWVERECLGQMFLDKDYFSKFLDRPDIQNGDGAAHQLRSNANEALDYFETRQQFWRQQNPIYARKGGSNFNRGGNSKCDELEKDRPEICRTQYAKPLEEKLQRTKSNSIGKGADTPTSTSSKPKSVKSVKQT